MDRGYHIQILTLDGDWMDYVPFSTSSLPKSREALTKLRHKHGEKRTFRIIERIVKVEEKVVEE